MKKILFCYFASIATITGFFTALFFNAIPLAIIFIVAFTACLLWFGDVMRIMDKHEQTRVHLQKARYNTRGVLQGG